jgi:hypothetical protein
MREFKSHPVYHTKENAMYRLDKEKDAALISRLVNWKFGQALQHLRDDHPWDVQDLVKSLAMTFGSPGWFDGTMSAIVRAAIDSLMPEEDEDEKRSRSSVE